MPFVDDFSDSGADACRLEVATLQAPVGFVAPQEDGAASPGRRGLIRVDEQHSLRYPTLRQVVPETLRVASGRALQACVARSDGAHKWRGNLSLPGCGRVPRSGRGMPQGARQRSRAGWSTYTRGPSTIVGTPTSARSVGSHVIYGFRAVAPAIMISRPSMESARRGCVWCRCSWPHVA